MVGAPCLAWSMDINPHANDVHGKDCGRQGFVIFLGIGGEELRWEGDSFFLHV